MMLRPDARAASLVTMLLAAALVAASCAAPGAGRLWTPPAGMPPVLAAIPADSMAFTLVDADPSSKAWRKLDPVLDEEDAADIVDAVLARAVGDELAGAADAWVGDVVGSGLRVLDVDESTAGERYVFGDVADRGALEQVLEQGGWSRGTSSAMWPDIDGDVRTWLRRPAGDVDLPAIAVFDEGFVAADSSADLKTVLDAAEESPAAGRATMATYAADASKASPLAVVIQTELARQQLTRYYQDDPASLQLSRWATGSTAFKAMRDGWLGVAASRDAGATASSLRIVGAFDWIGEIAPELQLERASADLLDRLAADTSLGVAVDDPGAIIRSGLDQVVGGSVGFPTELEVQGESKRIELLPLLDRMDGGAAAGWSGDAGRAELHLETGGDAELASDVQQAIEVADVDAAVDQYDGALVVTAPAPRAGEDGGSRPTLGAAARAPEDLRAVAGRASGRVVALPWVGRGRCVGPASGWISWDGVARLAVGIGLDVADPACPSAHVAHALMIASDVEAAVDAVLSVGTESQGASASSSRARDDS